MNGAVYDVEACAQPQKLCATAALVCSLTYAHDAYQHLMDSGETLGRASTCCCRGLATTRGTRPWASATACSCTSTLAHSMNLFSHCPYRAHGSPVSLASNGGSSHRLAHGATGKAHAPVFSQKNESRFA